MAKKKTAAAGKAAKTPTAKQLEAQISSLTTQESTLKHDAAAAKTAASRKHDLAAAATAGTRITADKHALAAKQSAKKKTGLALAPGDVACCAAQAVAVSLRLALGVTVHDEDVLALYWRTAGDPDEGASVLATLEAAREHGLGPGRMAAARVTRPGHRNAAGCSASGRWPRPPARISQGTPLILSLSLPAGPHAVTAGPDGSWWSWGEPYSPDDFPGAVITEARAVTW